jgi:glycosyltransferase involved in cell wall biosynthesis
VIGVLTTSYPRGPRDHAGHFVRERVRALVRDGHQVQVVAACDGSTEEAPDGAAVLRIPVAGGLFYAGGAPERLEQGPWLERVRALVEGARFAACLAHEATRLRGAWTAVESHWLLPCALVACAVAPGLPHRAHAHGGDVYLLARLPGGDSLARVLCRSGAELVFASAALRARFTLLCGTQPEALGARTRVEPAPCDLGPFYPRPPEERRRLRRKLGIRGRTVLAAGRLVPIKGYDVLVRAVALVPSSRRPRLLLAGEGPAARELARLASRLCVELRLAGALDRAVLAEVMAAADLFVHPCRVLRDGRSEGSPVVVREALAAGLPVIASASGGLPELAHPRLALVPPEDPAALAATITAVLSR